MTLVPVPTKTARCHSDIKGRRPFDVPANNVYFIFRYVKRLNPRTSTSVLLNFQFTALLSQSGITFDLICMVRLHQNLPQSKDVESILRTEVLVESTNLSCQFVGIVLCTNDALHNKIRNDVSEQVCHSYRCPTRWYEPFGEGLSRLRIDGNSMSEFTFLN